MESTKPKRKLPLSRQARRVADPMEAEFAGLSQQVTNLEGDYRDLKGVVVNLDRKMDAGFASLNAKIDSRNVTPWASIWAALGVLLAGMTTVGWLALQPIQASVQQNRLEIAQEFIRRRDEDREIRRRLDETKSQLDWTNGWMAGKLSFPTQFVPPTGGK